MAVSEANQGAEYPTARKHFVDSSYKILFFFSLLRTPVRLLLFSFSPALLFSFCFLFLFIGLLKEGLFKEAFLKERVYKELLFKEEFFMVIGGFSL